MTLKALELLTDCYILVQGSTVCVMGNYKQLKIVRRIIVDCMKNIHPIYHIKELMIKRELMKKPEMANESWDRFLPNYQKHHVKKKKVKKIKKEYNPFPNEQQPRKIDLLLQSGDYFFDEKNKSKKESNKKIKKKIENKEIEEEKMKKRVENQKQRDEMKEIKKNRFIAPKEDINTGKKDYTEDINVEEFKKKFLGKKKNRTNDDN